MFECPGIGDTTPQSLWERWHDDTSEPLNVGVGHGYFPMQVLFDSVERAGTLDSDAINKALSETDMRTINYRVQFEQETQVSIIPLFLGQWQKTNEPWIWDDEIVFSEHDFMPATAEMVFPIPYE